MLLPVRFFSIYKAADLGCLQNNPDRFLNPARVSKSMCYLTAAREAAVNYQFSY